jgi:hypothetical protein
MGLGSGIHWSKRHRIPDSDPLVYPSIFINENSYLSVLATQSPKYVGCILLNDFLYSFALLLTGLC